jgi:hypothetical protein
MWWKQQLDLHLKRIFRGAHSNGSTTGASVFVQKDSTLRMIRFGFNISLFVKVILESQELLACTLYKLMQKHELWTVDYIACFWRV